MATKSKPLISDQHNAVLYHAIRLRHEARAFTAAVDDYLKPMQQFEPPNALAQAVVNSRFDNLRDRLAELEKLLSSKK